MSKVIDVIEKASLNQRLYAKQRQSDEQDENSAGEESYPGTS